MRIAVTGATGNIGTSLLLAFERDPEVESVVGIARRAPSWRPSKVEWQPHDIVTDDLRDAFRGADAVVHLAWWVQPSRPERAMAETNLLGTYRVVEAAIAAEVPAIVHASSLAAYRPGPKDHMVDESHPIGGVDSLAYSRQKAAIEWYLDAVEQQRPDLRIVRMRPALVLKPEAAWEIQQLFLTPGLPRWIMPVPGLARLLRDDGRATIWHALLRTLMSESQVVHSLDVGDAFRRAATHDVRGAFNLAAPPALGGREARGGIAMDAGRAAVTAAFAAGLIRLDPGWIDVARAAPLMDTTRARVELGWEPAHDAVETLEAFLGGLRRQTRFPTPALTDVPYVTQAA